jgi:hypothetical protein
MEATLSDMRAEMELTKLKQGKDAHFFDSLGCLGCRENCHSTIEVLSKRPIFMRNWRKKFPCTFWVKARVPYHIAHLRLCRNIWKFSLMKCIQFCAVIK